MSKSAPKELAAKPRAELIAALEARFAKNTARHKGITWAQVLARLEKQPAKLWSLAEMEKTGGEPDVIGQDKKTSEFLFVDCSLQSPAGRHSTCYDRAALDARKEHKPKTSAMDLAEAMAVEMLDEDQYRALQKLGEFDTKSSSWIKTPDAIRKLGGALFCDRRYDHVFTYHNGAQSYYSGRGFRGLLKV